MNFMYKTLLIAICFFAISLNANEKQLKTKLLLSLNGIPWGMTFLDKNKLLINQKDGKVFLYDLNSKELTSISNAPKSILQGQGGLLDVQISPNYKKDKWIYITHVKKVDGKATTVLSRGKLNKNSFYDIQELLVAKATSSTGVHFGSRITFDKKGHLYFSIGDRGVRKNAQNLLNHSGKILRLNLDGTIPKDNPFIKNKKALNEIFSYGHRNPQGLYFDNITETLYSIEHGPRGGDEINIIEKGQNYGWPIISYGKEYWAPIAVGESTHKMGMEQPIKVYIPSIAPSSLLVYSGKLFKQYKGNLFSGALKLRHINRIVLDKDKKVIKEERLFKNLNERIRNIIEGPNGFIYFSTDNGKIFKISKNGN